MRFLLIFLKKAASRRNHYPFKLHISYMEVKYLFSLGLSSSFKSQALGFNLQPRQHGPGWRSIPSKGSIDLIARCTGWSRRNFVRFKVVFQ